MISSSDWEEPLCPVCHTHNPPKGGKILYKFPLTIIPGFEGTEGPFSPAELKIVRCERCELVYLSPRPKESAMSKIYESPEYFEGGAQGGYDDYKGQEKALQLTFRWFLRKLKKKGYTGGTLLDVGCGPGLFLKEARHYFHRIIGTDLSKEVAQEAASHCHEAFCGGPLAAKSRGPFDLITAIGVLEHVYEPVKFLRECASLLKDDGHLVIVTPDIMGFWHKLMKRRWPSFKLPEHIAYYSQPSMEFLAHRAGLQISDLFPYHQAFPLDLVLKRMGFRVSKTGLLKRVNIPLPSVMTTVILTKDGENSRQLSI